MRLWAKYHAASLDATTSKLRERTMIKVSFLYPYRENGRFDIDYYCNTHMPMVAEKLGDALKGWSVDVGLAAGPAPAFVAIGHTLFDSVDAFKAAIQPHGKLFAADLPNYSDGDPPIVLISDRRAGT
jgi:uncharacterized protein (TIGR02118 family)